MPTTEVISDGVVHISDMPGKEFNIVSVRNQISRKQRCIPGTREHPELMASVLFSLSHCKIARLPVEVHPRDFKRDHHRQQFQDVYVVSKLAENDAGERGVKVFPD